MSYVISGTARLEQLEQHSIFIDQELQYLARIPDIPSVCDKNNTKFYVLAFNICTDLADMYEQVGIKEKAVDTLQLAITFNEQYKYYINRGIRGSVPAIRQMKRLTREMHRK